MVRYVSTRGAAPVLGFGDVLLKGLADDGGLYVPDAWPTLATGWDRPRSYADTAVEVMWPYVEGSIDRADFERLVGEAYATFDHPDVCPVVELEDAPAARAVPRARRSPSRTWPCSWSAGCSTTS